VAQGTLVITIDMFHFAMYEGIGWIRKDKKEHADPSEPH